MNLFTKNKFIKELQKTIVDKDYKISFLENEIHKLRVEIKVRGDQEDNEVKNLASTVSHEREMGNRLIDTLQIFAKNPVNVRVINNGD